VPQDELYGEYAGAAYNRFLQIRITPATHSEPQYYYIGTDVTYASVSGGGEDVCIDTHSGADQSYFKQYGFHTPICNNVFGAGMAHESCCGTIPMHEKFQHLAGEHHSSACLVLIGNPT
jgi:hypothetical protein